ncbi:addiction module protein [Corallococcus sp. bb12-1]|uniref:addiction module protein n=1 Tax=Corallococcus sp. bb12-1 TaxID=2996784 RepID=UPI002270CA11|nr:addiction module protein [Corallococcus sp. bb12-1]MCY1040928.1 addiction module protein [Corallococcus sp. bb12-1]
MATVDEVLTDALRLSREERARVAHELLLSLDESAEAQDVEEDWTRELANRAQEVMDGTVKLVSLEEARKLVEERLERVRRRR